MRLKKKRQNFSKSSSIAHLNKKPQFKQCQVVDHFVREGIARRTEYNALNRRKNGQSILEVTRSGRPSSWTSSMKVKLKRLVNHRKGVSRRKLGDKFNKHHMIISRQIKN